VLEFSISKYSGVLVASQLILIAVLYIGALALMLGADTFRSKEQGAGQPTPSTTKLGILALVLLSAVAAAVISTSLTGLPDIQSKGGGVPSRPWLLVGLMYASMVLGTLAQAFYFRAGQANWSSVSEWVKPVLVSPVIFIPLISSYQTALSHVEDFGIGELMMLLFAFQNGFFWRAIFDKQAELFVRRRKGRQRSK
jgi:hypothetical protein